MSNEPTSLASWVARVAPELGLDADDVDVVAVLDLARDAAHQIQRPAAPVATFLAGYLAGLRGGGQSVAREAVDVMTELVGRKSGDQHAR